jgi:hypothetical protein
MTATRDLNADLKSIAANDRPVSRPEPEYECHPLANLFPLLEGAEYQALIEDIKKNGLREKIKLHEGKILDGRNRSRACKEAWVKPEYDALPPGTDPLAFVISANLHRRHLNETQRGIVAAKIANMRRGGKEANPSIGGIANISQEDAAKLLNVSTKTVERASKLVGAGVPELVTKAEQGKVKVSAAIKFLEKPEPERQKLLDNNAGNIVKAVKKSSGAVSTASTNNSDSYDKVQKALIEKLEKMGPEQAEAAAQKTIEELARTVRTKKGGKHSLKLAA